MIKSKKLRVALMGVGAMSAMAAVLASCGGADGVASPGEGSFWGGFSSSSSSSTSSSSASSSDTAATSCPAGFTNAGVIANKRNCQLPNRIVGNLNLPKLPGVVYSISGRVDVGYDMGADAANPLYQAGGEASTKGVLSVDPGVTVFGSQGLDYIAVNRGSQISASGTVSQPIVFTSRQNVEGAGAAIGQWGGIILLGRAPTNLCPTNTPPATLDAYKDCTGVFEAVATLNYGGNKVDDSSGTLKYVQIRYSGYAIAQDKEINGLTIAGVGAGTVLDYINVYNSSDDGIEAFGGTANLKHLVLTGNDDEQFDTDLNYSGSVQFMIAKQRDNGGDFLFEMSCNKSGSGGITSMCPPPSSYSVRANIYPKISNATLIMRSSTNKDGIKLDTGTGLGLYNSVVTSARTGGAGACLVFNNANTLTTMTQIGGANAFKSVFFSCATSYKGDAAITSDQIKGVFEAGANVTPAGVTSLADFVNGTNETAVIAYDATALNTFANNNMGFFVKTTYVGAVKDSTDTWWKGWSCGLDVEC